MRYMCQGTFESATICEMLGEEVGACNRLEQGNHMNEDEDTC